MSEARRSAKRFHRSLSGQIEHWAALGKAIEARLPGDILEQLLGGEGTAVTIGEVGEVIERERVADILVRFVAQSPEATDRGWLDEIRRSGVPANIFAWATTTLRTRMGAANGSGKARPRSV